MKTTKLTSAIAIFSLVLFMSSSSIAGAFRLNSENTSRSGDRSLVISTAVERDFSYLRFDVNKFVNENDETDAIYGSLDYLRFDVNDFVNQSETIEMELPAANEFEYLRFDVNNFSETYENDRIDLPVNEFDYLRFDVNNYTTTAVNVMDELPETK